MATYTTSGDTFIQRQDTIFEFGAPESHQQRTVDVGLTATPALVQNIDGRSWILRGTPYPSDDANCEGLIMWDYDVTNGDRLAALIHRGDINLPKVERFHGSLPSAEALVTLHEDYEFQFFPPSQYKAIAATVTP